MASSAILLSLGILLIAQADTRPSIEEFKAGVSYQKEKAVYQYESKTPREDFQGLYRFIRKEYPQVSSEDAKQIAESLVDYGHENQLDPRLIAALISKESSFNKHAVSKTGAKGLGQIKSFNFNDLKIQNPFNIRQNVRGTSRYLKSLFQRWSGEDNSATLALASYYKGPNAVAGMKDNLDQDARKYAKSVLKQYEKIKKNIR